MNFSVRRTRLSALFALVGLCAAAVACADDAIDDVDPTSEAIADAGDEASPSQPPVTDDGGVDGDASSVRDASDDAPKKTCTVQGWCHTEVPPEQTLRAVWGDGTGTVWTVSEQGSILRWDGSKWSTVYNDSGAFFAIWGSGPTDIWVGGENGLFHGSGTTSATLSWTKFATDGNVPVLSVWGTAPNDVWAVGNDGTVSRVLHYAGPPADPATSGWTVDPVTAGVPGKLVKIWGNSASDIWTAGSTLGEEWGQNIPLIWHGSPNDDGVVTFVQDTSFDYFFESSVAGGYTADTNHILWFGANYGSPFMLWGTRADSSQPYEWADAFDWKTSYPWSCSTELHNNVLVYAEDDIWTVGNFGRLCHFDGTHWTLSAVSVENVPLENVFWDAWAPNKDASRMWVVGQGVALRKQPTSNP